ncbi:hypothetical protein ACFU53_38265, partial [Streptomyces sp. NPDC057474]|uniref:hypothetical protein n=1 Tax=Streptomyces sp. NPDC057474 TaxID=3346144 RepID=UPI0036ACA044
MKVSLQLAGRCVLTQQDRQVLLEPDDLALSDTASRTRWTSTTRTACPWLMFPRVMPKAYGGHSGGAGTVVLSRP